MSVIGNLECVTNNGEKEYWGNIKTLQLNIDLRVVESKDFKSNPNSPDLVVMAKLKDGSETQIGSGWLKVPNKVGSKINEFISLTIDDPSMDKPLNVAAFPKEGGVKWDITFRRRQNIPNAN